MRTTFFPGWREVAILLMIPDGYVSRIIFKLRSGVHCLNGHLLRYDGVSRFDRICSLCKLEAEDSFHFLGSCSALATIRSKFYSDLLSLVDRLPKIHQVIARSVFLNLSTCDTARILLGAPQFLSCSLFRFESWFPLLADDVFFLTLRTIRDLYCRRNELVHSV